MKFLLAFLLTLYSTTVADTVQPPGIPFKSSVTVAPGFSAHVIFSNLTTPRGIAFDSNQNLLVVERGFGITAFSPVTPPSKGWSRTVVIKSPDFTQGIQVDGTDLYLSTASQALVYKYDPVAKSVSGTPVTLVTGIPADGELVTHTLQLEKNGPGKATAILIGSGPRTNIDPTARDPSSGRSQVRQFTVTSPSLPHSWLSGKLIAYGIRNPAGFAFPPGPPPDTLPAPRPQKLYVVENGASIDNVTGLTPTFVNDNPADEMVLVDLTGAGLGQSYGFPDCTTLWNPEADPVGVPQYVGLHKGDQISLNLDPERPDKWCRDPKNNIAPVLSFQAHSVPLDLKFYPKPAATGPNAFPPNFAGDAFVSFHGSFNRKPPTGYGVVHVPFPLGSSPSSLGYSFMIQATNLDTCPGSCIRPVGLAFGQDGNLYVSSDSSGELFVIERAQFTPNST